ncbi:MAG: hypothetical protein LJF04_04655 [Gemmatimonadetes bacterium]|nr:hypothetical protein [Gemmatimonadota bacterium]
MTDPNHLPRIYDDKEVGKLLERATELQRQDPAGTPASRGLSLTELEEVAAEAGIDPRFLRQAAAEMASGSRAAEGWEVVTGERLTVVREAVVPGELDQDGFERVAEAIQVNARETGQASLLGRTLTWQAETAGKTRTIQLFVTSRSGETHIRAVERLHQMASGLFAGTVVGVGAGVGLGAGLPIALTVLGSPLLAVAFPLGVAGVTLMGCREIYRRIVRSRDRAVGTLVNAIVEAAGAAIAEQSLRGPERPPELPRG